MKVLSISHQSSVWAEQCVILYTDRASIPFHNLGRLTLTNLRVLQSDSSSLAPLALIDTRVKSTDMEKEIDPSITVSSCTFTNTALQQHYGTFIVSGGVMSQEISDCVFRNISLTNQPPLTSFSMYTLVDDAVVAGTIIEDSEDTLYGCILSGVTKTGHRFECSNSTFERCTRNFRPTIPSKAQLLQNGCDDLPTSGSHDDFTGENCLYTTRGYLKIRDSKYGYHGNHRFTNCTWKDTSTTGDGGGLNSNSIDCTVEVNWTRIEQCFFFRCHADGDGGGVCVCGLNNLKLTDTTFIGCSAGDEGGGVYIQRVDDDYTVSGCRFGGNTASRHGQDFSTRSQKYYSVSSCIAFVNTANRACKYNTSDSSCSWKDGDFPYASPQFSVVSTLGKDHSCYSETTSECVTIKDVLDRWMSPIKETLIIKLIPGSHTAEKNTISFSGSSLKIQNKTGSASTFRVTSSFTGTNVFEVSGTTFELYHFTIDIQKAIGGNLIQCKSKSTVKVNTMTIQSSQNYQLSSLFSFSAGTIQFDSSTLKTFKVSGPLFSLSGSPSLSFSSTYIETITRTKGNGAVFSSPTFSTLSGITFTSCVCSSGNGGAIYVSLGGSSSFKMESLSFTSCNAAKGDAVYVSLTGSSSSFHAKSCTFTTCDNADYRGCVYIDMAQSMMAKLESCTFNSVKYKGGSATIKCSDGQTLANNANWTQFTSSYSKQKSTANNFWVIETTTARAAQQTTLLHFRYSPKEDSSYTTVYVSTSGADLASCGWSELQCVSISTALGHMYGSGTIQLSNAGTHEAETVATALSSSVDITIQGAATSVKKKLASISEAEYLYTMTARTHTIKSLTFVLANKLTTSLLSASGGVVKLTQLTLAPSSGTCTLSRSLVTLSGGTSTLTSCSFNSLSLSTGGNGGAALSASLSGSTSLTVTGAQSSQSSFTSCSSTGLAGAIYVSLSDASPSLAIHYTSFTTCSGSSAANLYVVCVNATSKLTKSMCEDNTPDISATLESGSYCASETVTERAPFTAPISHFLITPSAASQSKMYLKGVVDGKNQGLDYSGCGWSDIPCMTINKAYANRGSITQFDLSAETHIAETASTTFTVATTITGQTDTKKTVTALTAEANPLAVFVVTADDSTVSFSTITFILDKEQVLTCNLFRATSGKISLSTVSVAPDKDENDDEENPLSISSSLVQIIPAEDKKAEGAIDSCSFSHVVLSEGNGAAINAILVSSASLTLTGDAEGTKTSFTDCSTEDEESCGGAVYIEAAANDVSITVDYVEFSGCKCHSLDHAGNIFITCATGSDILDYDNWKNHFTDYEAAYAVKEQYWVKETRTGGSAEGTALLHFFFTPASGDDEDSVYVSVSGASGDTCGWSDLACLTLKDALDHRDTTKQPRAELGSGVHAKEEQIEISEGVSVSGKIGATSVPHTRPVMCVGSSPLFLVTADVLLTVECITFTQSPPSTLSHNNLDEEPALPSSPILSASFIDASNGKLKLEWVSFEDVTLATDSLLAISTTSADSFIMNTLTVTEDDDDEQEVAMKCEFLRITRQDGSGAVFDCLVGESGYLSINNAKFDECKCTKDDSVSGAIHITLSEEPTTLELKNNEFVKCYYGGAESTTIRNLLLICVDANYLTADMLQDTTPSMTAALTKEEYIVIETLTNDNNKVITTSFYHRAIHPSSAADVNDQNIHVYEGADTAADLPTCGWTDLPCLSLAHAVNERSTVQSVLIDGTEIAMKSVIVVDETFTLMPASDDDDSTVTVSVDSITPANEEQSLLQISSDDASKVMTLERLVFELQEEIAQIESFISSSTHIALNSITFSTNAHSNAVLGYSLLSVTGGILEADTVTSQSINFGSGVSPLVIDSSATATLSGLDFTTITLSNSLIMVEDTTADTTSHFNPHSNDDSDEEASSNKFSILSSNFTTITSSSLTAPSVLTYLSPSKSTITIGNSNFTTCTSPTSIEGGAMKISFTEQDKVKLSDCITKSCACKAENDAESLGRGGFLYLDCSGLTLSSSSSLTQILFSLSSTTFTSNVADVGRDVFLLAQDVPLLLKYSKLVINFASLDSTNSMYAHNMKDDTYGETSNDFDLIPHIRKHMGKTIHVSSSSSAQDILGCGTVEVPCATISEGILHLDTDQDDCSVILNSPQGQSITFGYSCVYKDFTLSPPTTQKETITLLFTPPSTLVDDDDEEMIAYITAQGTFSVAYIDFVIVPGFSSSYSSFIGASDSCQLLLNDSSFSIGEVLSAEGISYLLISQAESKVTLNRITIHNIPRKSGTYPEQSLLSHSSSSSSSSLSSNNEAIDGLFVLHGDLSMDGCTVDGSSSSSSSSSSFTLSIPFITLTSSVQLHVSNSNFSHFTLTSSPSFFTTPSSEEEEYEKEMSFTGTQFEDISSLNSMSTILYSYGKTTLEKTTFHSITSATVQGEMITLHGPFSITGCVFDLQPSSKTQHTHNMNTAEATSGGCEWEGSLVRVDGGSGEIKETSFVNSTNGALDVTGGGSVTLTAVTFNNNQPENPRFPEIRHNILCSSSDSTTHTQLTLSSIKDGDGKTTDDSLWMLNDGCELAGLFDTYLSTFFIPSLSSAESTATSDGSIQISLNGTLLIDCDLEVAFSLTTPPSTPSSSSLSSSPPPLPLSSAVPPDSPSPSSSEEEEDSASSSSSSSLYSYPIVSTNHTHATCTVAADDELIPFITAGTVKASLMIPSSQTHVPGEVDVVPPHIEKKSEASDGGGGGNMMLIIIIIAAGAGLVVVALIVIIIICIILRRRRRNANRASKKSADYEEEPAQDVREMKNLWMIAEADHSRTDSTTNLLEVIKKSNETTHSDKHPQNMLVAQATVDMDTELVDVPTMSLDTGTIPVQALSREGERREESGHGKRVRGKGCMAPYAEKEVGKWKTMGEWLHGERGGGSGEKRGGDTDTMLGLTMVAPTFGTSTIRTEGMDEWEMRGRVGATVSVVECASEMVKEKNDENVWKCLLSLSPSRILLSSPLPSLDHIEQGYGVFINLEDPTDEEKNLALRYLAPEISGSGDNDELAQLNAEEKEKAVVFALGLVMWEVMTGEAPFNSEVDVTAHRRIQKGELPSLEEIEDEEMMEVLGKMLSWDPAMRPTLMNAGKMLREQLNESDDEEDEEEDYDMEE